MNFSLECKPLFNVPELNYKILLEGHWLGIIKSLAMLDTSILGN